MKRIVGIILILIISITSLFSCIPLDLIDLTPGYFTYTDFTNKEKNIFTTYIGEVIPFAPTDKYFVTETHEGKGYESGVRYYTIGNSEQDFADYLDALHDLGYKFKCFTDGENGTKWNEYSKGNISLTTAYYKHNGKYFLDVCVYYLYLEPNEKGTLSNKGKKPPKEEDGVLDIDFTKAQHALDVGDLSDNILSCPSVGAPAVLVIPVEFPDVKASSKGYTIDNIERIFTGENDYYSVDEYYYLSSYGKLDLDITIIDEWFTAEKNSSYYKYNTTEYNGERINIGDQVLMNEVLDYLDDKMDLSKFDSDDNGTIDSIVIVNTLDVNGKDMFNWAYEFRNIYDNESGSYYKYDGVYAYDYIWISYGFMHEKELANDNFSYSDKSIINPKAFIHEFAHIIGVKDYYDTSNPSLNGPMKGLDIMDNALGDHNPFTKFSLGWIDRTRLVTTDSSLTLTLKPFSESGDTIIIGNNFSEELGAFQEYFVLIYYRNTGLNNNKDNYFDDDGIVLYHVNATLYYEEFLLDTFYILENTNTKGETANYLLELVRCAGTKYILAQGGTLRTIYDDNEEMLHYTYTVDSLTSESATITFTLK